MDFTLEGANMHRLLYGLGVNVMSETGCSRIEAGRAQLFNIWGDGHKREFKGSGKLPRKENQSHEWLDCDTVILVTSRCSRDGLYRELKARKPEWGNNGISDVFVIGDAEAPRIIADATFDGHRLAREIEDPDPQHQKPFKREQRVWGVAYNPGEDPGLVWRI
jgi:dimethylamine/trimethylamine dehydrogenase